MPKKEVIKFRVDEALKQQFRQKAGRNMSRVLVELVRDYLKEKENSSNG